MDIHFEGDRTRIKNIRLEGAEKYILMSAELECQKDMLNWLLLST